MRILFLTNYYPPYEIGGQGKSCRDVVEGLAARGHDCLVLTSMHGTGNVPVTEEGVRRWLYLEMDMAPLRHIRTFFLERKRRERHNLARLERLIAAFQPDVIFIWGMWNLPRSLPALAERLVPGKVAYRFAEYWPTLPSQHEMYWRTPAKSWKTRLPKGLLRPLALAMLRREPPPPGLSFPHAMCVSAATRRELIDAGLPLEHARVIYTGLDVGAGDSADLSSLEKPSRARTSFDATTSREAEAGDSPQLASPPLRLLYAGRLAAEKGVETAIHALAELVQQGRNRVVLNLAGSGQAAYQQQLRALSARLGLEDALSFLGRVPLEEMPALMRAHDVLLVPSIWPEPFARVVLEGMISGMVVVATPAGGSAEIVRDGENGLLFPPGDSHALARCIVRLAEDPGLRRQLAQAGRQTVLEHFTRQKMMDQIENFLLQAAACKP